MKHMQVLLRAGALASLIAVGGCEGVMNDVVGQPGGDDFQAAKAPPLALPPDYNLRPPVPGGRGAPDRQASDQAKLAVFGINQPGVTPSGGNVVDTQQSAGERALLNRAGSGARTGSGIRTEIDQETQDLKQSEDAFVDKIVNYDDENPPPEDAQGDGDSILKDIVSGEGKPVIKRKGGIFD